MTVGCPPDGNFTRQAIITIIYSIADEPADFGLQILTDFGDSAVLVPISVVFFIWLLMTRSVGIAFAWVLALIACNAVIAVLKIYFLACPFGELLNSPSGHAGFSVLVYGSLTAAVAIACRSPRYRAGIIAVGVALVAAIAASRLMLHSHGSAEVILGMMVGAASLAFFVRLYRRGPGKSSRFVPLALAVLVVTLFFHGRKLPAEDYLRDFSSVFAGYTRACALR